jgi:hypothetical protein
LVFGLNDVLLGGIVPLVAAAIAFGIGWAAVRSSAVAQSAGVIVGYAAGVTALEARNVGFSAAIGKLIQPGVAHQWTPLLALAPLVPAIAAAMLGQRRGLRWILAAVICAAAPAWLLWGGKYLPSPEVRESGFATSAWGGLEATAILAALSSLMLLAWYLWEAAAAKTTPRGHSLLAIFAITGAAAAAGLTGSFVYAQLLGVLAASLGGCFIASWLLNANVGPEAAAGSTIVLAGALLLLAACYSELRPWQAAGVWAAIMLADGWIPSLHQLPSKTQLVIRAIACVLLITIVVGQAGLKFSETQRQQQQEQEQESNPYLDL